MKAKIRMVANLNDGTTRISMTLNSGKRISKVIHAYELNHATSEDKKYFIIQVCNSNHEDSSKCFLFNLDSGELIFGIKGEWGWADGYVFTGQHDTPVKIKTREGLFLVNRDGNLTNLNEYRRTVLTSGLESSIRMAEKLMKEQPSKDLCELVIKSMDKTLLRLNKSQNDYKSLALRFKGQAFESLGDKRNALLSYKKALKINPKVGVKRKFDSLVKEIGDIEPTESKSFLSKILSILKK